MGVGVGVGVGLEGLRVSPGRVRGMTGERDGGPDAWPYGDPEG